MTTPRTILVLGGGVGGLLTAVRLRRRLTRRHRVVLVDREANHLFAPSLLWLMVRGRTAAQISRPLEGSRSKGVTFTEVHEDGESALREQMVERAGGRRTVPQIFIGGVAVGGCDDLYALEREGRLDTLLADRP
jgi:glutaredoxin